MRDIIDEAFEAGRAAALYEMAELARIRETWPNAVAAATSPLTPSLPWTKARKPSGTPKAVTAPTAAAKAPNIIARGVRKAGAPRTKGVKEALMALIDVTGGMSVPDIIAKTGFKETSVRATLMSLKKNGIAAQDGKLWGLASGAQPAHSNSEAVAHAD